MKKILLMACAFALGFMQFSNVSAIDYLEEDDTILNTQVEEAVGYEDIEHGDTENGGTEGFNPLRDGTQKSVEDVGGIISSDTSDQIERYDDGQLRTLKLIKNIINYALGFLGLIALIYLLYHGFLVVTAGDDEEKYKEALKSLKTGFLAIGGIALSWFIVTFIFYVISLVTDINVFG